MKAYLFSFSSSAGLVLAAAPAETASSWRHDADKWGIAFVLCVILWFAARWIARREDESQRKRDEREEREIKAREARELASHQERAALMERNNELQQQLLDYQISHGRRLEKLVEAGNAAQSNTAQAITSWTRKMKRPCVMQVQEDSGDG